MNKKILGSLVAVGLASSACSSDDDSDADDTTASPTATAGTEPPAHRSARDRAGRPPTRRPPSAPDRPTTGDDRPPAGVRARRLVRHRRHPRHAAVGDRRRPLHHRASKGADGLIYTAGFTSDRRRPHVRRVPLQPPTERPTTRSATAARRPSTSPKAAAAPRSPAAWSSRTTARSSSPDRSRRIPTAEGDAAGDLDVAVIRLDADGTLDATFGEGGIAKIDLGAGKTIDAETYITDNAWGLTARDGGYAVFAVDPEPGRPIAPTSTTPSSGSPTPARSTTRSAPTASSSPTSTPAATTPATSAPRPTASILATGYSRDGDGVVSPVLIRMSRRTACSTRRSATAASPTTSSCPASPSRTRSCRRATTTSSPATAAARTPRRRSTSSSTASSPTAAGTRRFGTDGVTRLDLAGEDDRARNLTILPDGNILAVGSGKLDADNVDAMVVMLDPDGALVETFGDGGHLLVDLGGPGDAFFGVSRHRRRERRAHRRLQGRRPRRGRQRRRRPRPPRPLTRTPTRGVSQVMSSTARGRGSSDATALAR